MVTVGQVMWVPSAARERRELDARLRRQGRTLAQWLARNTASCLREWWRAQDCLQSSSALSYLLANFRPYPEFTAIGDGREEVAKLAPTLVADTDDAIAGPYGDPLPKVDYYGMYEIGSLLRGAPRILKSAHAAPAVVCDLVERWERIARRVS